MKSIEYLRDILIEKIYINKLLSDIFAKKFFDLKGLSQNHQKTNGFGHNQKEVGEFVLLEWKRMYSGFQYYVHQLLCLQQARGGCCGHGTSSRKVISYKGIFFNICFFLHVFYLIKN